MMANRTTTDFHKHHPLTKVLLGTPTVLIIAVNRQESKYIQSLMDILAVLQSE